MTWLKITKLERTKDILERKKNNERKNKIIRVSGKRKVDEG
jgi:hypothetical protein